MGGHGHSSSDTTIITNTDKNINNVNNHSTVNTNNTVEHNNYHNVLTGDKVIGGQLKSTGETNTGTAIYHLMNLDTQNTGAFFIGSQANTASPQQTVADFHAGKDAYADLNIPNPDLQSYGQVKAILLL